MSRSPEPPAGSGAACQGFAGSLAQDAHGQATPEEAVAEFARHPEFAFPVPATGWRRTKSGDRTVELVSGGATLRTFQVKDGSWVVESGQSCTG